jgi:hypothetical protein
MTTSWEVASKCPKCIQPGEVVGERKLTGGRGKLVTLRCVTAYCKWFDTTYAVQVNPDGTVPDPITSRPKEYPARPDDGGRTEQVLRGQLAQSMKPEGGEVR